MNGIQIYSKGSGPSLVLTAGGPGISSRVYRDFLDPLTGHLRLHFWDYRGSGASIPTGPFHSEQDRQDLEEVIGTLGLSDGSYTLVGHSYGGLPVLRLVLSGSKKPKSLILLSSSPALGRVVASLHERKCNRLGPENAARFHHAFQAILSGSPTREQEQTFLELEFRNHFAQIDPKTFDDFLSRVELSFPVFTTHADWLQSDLEPQLDQIRIPALVLGGERDTIIPPDFMKSFSRFPNGSSKILPDCGHWMFIEKFAEFSEILDSFLAGTR